MNRIVLSLVLTSALTVFSAQANAQCNSGYGGYGGSRGGGYGYSSSYGSYGNTGSGFGLSRSYYGNGGHDLQPHWHVTQTPNGANAWYGNGPHDLVPHHHAVTPWSYRGYSQTGAGPTTSFYNTQPGYFAPW